MAAELLACKEAALAAITMDVQWLHLETDSKEVHALMSKTEDDISLMGPLVRLIKDMLARRDWKISWRRRTANTAAHKLAKFSVGTEFSGFWGSRTPDCILDVLSDETLNFG